MMLLVIAAAALTGTAIGIPAAVGFAVWLEHRH